LTNLSSFLYLASRILLLEFQYCWFDTNNTNKQKQKIEDKENSKQEKEIRKTLLFYLIKRIFLLQKQLNTKAILNLREYNIKAILQAIANCRSCSQNKKVTFLDKLKQSSKARLIQFNQQYCANKIESLLLLNYIRS